MNFNTLPTHGRERTILVVHREPVIRLGLTASLAHSEFCETVRAYEPQNKALIDQLDWAAVVVTDYQHGVELCTRLSHEDRNRRWPKPSVMVVTPRQGEHDVRAAVDAGVKGYLLAGFELQEFIHGVRTLLQGSRYLCSAAAHKLVDSMSHEVLTSREMEVLRCIVDGKVNKRIGSELNIALGTVKAHVKSIFSKFDVATRTQAATLATQRGLLLPELRVEEIDYIGSGKGKASHFEAGESAKFTGASSGHCQQYSSIMTAQPAGR